MTSLLNKGNQLCPFCKVDMVRPRVGIVIGFGDDHFMRINCSSNHPDENTCDKCIYYKDYECPNCHVLLLYRA